MSARALVQTDTMGIMAPRTLANSHPTLLHILRPGVSVLDVGCGPGTLTMEIARRVDPGAVVGMDVNPKMIRAAEAATPPRTIPNLIFYTRDIQDSDWQEEFDVVNAARTLEWIADPAAALARMARAAVPGGLIVALDVDHTRATWSNPPASWIRFYRAFLAWREACGFDNAVGRRLPLLSEQAGLVDTTSTTAMTTVRAADADFFRVAGRWRMLIEGRGRQMVAAGHLRETERRGALDGYTGWMQDPDAALTVYETCILARRP